MKKIMVYAYTQFNLGDDLFIKILCERYPETTFILYAPALYKKTFQALDNIQFFPSDSLRTRGVNILFRMVQMPHIMRHLLARKCDAAVHIGGSLFIQQNNWRKNLSNWKAMHIKQMPYFLLGTNFGPYQDDAFYQEHKRIFEGYSDICFREKFSYELFSDLDHVRLADDIVFQLNKPNIQSSENTIVITVIKPSIRAHLATYDDIYYEKTSDIAVYLIEKGYLITLMAFCTYEKDDEAIREIIKIIPKKYLHRVKQYFYQTNLDGPLQIIAASRFIIASRFHAMILGWTFDKPVFPIVYSDKMQHVMDDIGFTGASTTFDQLQELVPAKVFASMETNIVDVSIQRKNAEKHFAKLDAYLGNG